MSDAEVEQLLELAIQAPTAFNIQNWRFVLITDQAVQDAVRTKGFDQAQFSDCSMIVVICGDRGAYDKPGDAVSEGTPSFLPALPEDAPRNRLSNDTPTAQNVSS